MRKQALNEIDAALEKLKKALPDEPAKKAVDEFEKSVKKLKEQFRKEPQSDPKEKPNRDSNLPGENIQGVISKVDSEGLVLIDLGSDAGLLKGQTLHVYRLEPKPEYLGEIRLIEVSPTTAVGKTVKPQAAAGIKVGDRVAAKIAGR